MPHLTGWLAKDLSQQELHDSLTNIDADTIVMFRNLSFEPVSAQVFSLNIMAATDVPTLREFHLFPPTTESQR